MLGAAVAAIVLSDLDAYWPLDLREPPGAFSELRLRMLAAEPEVCRRVLARSGIAAAPVPPLRPASEKCGFEDGVTLSGGALDSTPVMRCAAAAAYATWIRHVVEPAAARTLGARLVGVRNGGTYACRDIAGRPGRRSQHATANAIDVSGFVLSGGRVITVVEHWADPRDAGRFLRAVRAGACGQFVGVLSPDWNKAHRDHFHLDMGPFDVCR